MCVRQAFRFVLAALCAMSSLTVRAALTPPMTIEEGVMVGTMTSDRFTWYDSGHLARVAVLAHNTGQVGPGGTHGGELRLFQYYAGAATRTVAASSSGASGFGYVVSHPEDNEACIAGPDSSSFGHFVTGTFTRVFEGRHHAIFRFTQNYPRYCQTGAVAPAAPINIPVTIEWVFSTGRDNPLWAITYDMHSINADTLMDDSRAPYGELLFDGSATENAHSTVAGVGWGDRYKFVSTTNPVTMSSAWTWNVANTIPYVKLWTTAIDATMGVVQTQPITQQDAGGYYGTDRWNTTSASPQGDGCSAAAGGPHLMPCDYNWPFQSINYSFADFATATNNTRLAWGTNFGFLGQTLYHPHGSDYWGGPIPDAPLPGWPRKSYSTFIVLGTHTPDAVDAQVTQMETVQSLELSATTGSVVLTGPAGVDRADTVTYQPPGYNHVYSALAFNAGNNALDAGIKVNAGTLLNPMIIIGNYTGTAPRNVTLNGTPLTADGGYYASVRSAAQELWITLNASLPASMNAYALHVAPVVPGAPAIGNAVAGNGQATISFTPPNDDGGSPITSYTATCNPGNLHASANGSPITVGGMSNGTQYTCFVVAINAAGAGPASNGVTVTPGLGRIRGDANGDGFADLVWRNVQTGGNSMWFINGTSVIASASLPPVGDTNFKIVGIGDFQGDGKADILWRNQVSGANVEWLMNGPLVAVSTLLPRVADPNWQIAGVGDFQGDGKADIFWRNSATGDDSVWLMNGTSVAVSASMPTVADTNWKVAAIGDFQGDGKDDVLWRNSATGANVVWLMNGLTIGASAALPVVADSNWKIAGVGDLQGDGKADVVWRNSVTGDDAVWFMSGLTLAVTAPLTSVPDTNWKIVRIADFQGDGKADIVWRNSVSGADAQWLMDGPAIAVSTAFPTVADPNWQVAGVP